MEALALAVEAEVQAAVAPVGAIVMWPVAAPPTGWLICNGSTFSSLTYPALDTLLGGNTLPDLRQRFPLGKAAAGTGATLLGSGGAIDHTHTGPSHTHTTASHAHGVLAGITGTNSTLIQVQSGTGQNVAANNHTHTYGVGNTDTHPGAATDATGTGATGTSNPPFLSVHFIIRAA